MTQLILTIIIVSFFVYGVHVVISGFLEFFEVEGDRIYHTVLNKFAQFVSKPTWFCNVCMSSFWGSICYFGLLDQWNYFHWIVSIVCSAAIITIINNK